MLYRFFMFRRILFCLSFLVLQCVVSGQTPVTVAGISGDVTIRRDGRSIPYIEAKSDTDAYFAQGWATASDRLFQMDLMRRLARGETAEIFGRTVLEEDKRWRRFGFAKVVEEQLRVMDPALRAGLEAYARGVNAYIATLDEKTLPAEFRILQYRPAEWQPTDTLVLGKILSDALSTTWRNDLLRQNMQSVQPDKLADLTNLVSPYDVVLFGSDTRAKTAGSTHAAPGHVSDEIMAAADSDAELRARSLERVGLFAEELAASNNWVIAGKRTVDGKPILANDPHLAPTAPGIWYLTHLSTPSMRVSGVTVPGIPGIVLGHNSSIAWGATNVGPDVQDLYVETVNDKGDYRTPDGWQPLKKRTETIKFRANPLSPKTESMEYEAAETRNGPIILDEGGKRYSLKWTALDPKMSEFEVFFLLNRARNWNEFTGALKRYGGAAQNFVYADTQGNVGWYAASQIPIRRKGDGSMPYDGSTNDGDWVGYIPFEELPHLYNPPSGLIVTANQRIVGTDYKYTQMSRDAAAPWRARQIINVLDRPAKISLDDVAAAQFDSHNIPVHNLSKTIVKLGAASPETLAALRDWDGQMLPGSRAALLASDIRICVANKMSDANPGVPASIIRERVLEKAIAETLPRWLPSGVKDYAELIRGCDAAVRAQFADAKRYGPDDATWTWGRIWQSRFTHPLAAVPLIGAQFQAPTVAIPGSGQSPNVGSSVSMRHIATPANWDTTSHVIPLGQSGDPASLHFKDQFDAWSTGKRLIFPFTKTAVEKAATVSTVLSPKR
jgi:penicillin amidase